MQISPDSSSGQRRKREERRDALENRQRLLQTAHILFAEKGVEAVTMTDIAKAAGVGQGTLYRHFKHKGELCEALMEANMQQFQEQAEVNFGLDEAAVSQKQLLMLFLSHLAHFVESNTAFLQVTYSSEQAQEESSFYLCLEYQWPRGKVKRWLQGAVTNGECRADLDVEYMTDALLAPLQIDLYLYHRWALGLSVERIIAGLQQLVAGVVNKNSFSP